MEPRPTAPDGGHGGRGAGDPRRVERCSGADQEELPRNGEKGPAFERSAPKEISGSGQSLRGLVPSEIGHGQSGRRKPATTKLVPEAKEVLPPVQV